MKMSNLFCGVTLVSAWLAVMHLCGCSRKSPPAEELVVLVTDTSAQELFCTCSPDALKRYETLRAALSRALGRNVRFDYMSDFLFDSLPEDQAQRVRDAHLIIGKSSAIEHVSALLGIKSRCLGVLTRTDGNPEFNGVWVAKSEGGPHRIGDLAGKRISVGKVWHAEKHGDALRQLEADKIVPATVIERLLCKEELADVVAGVSDAAGISDYSAALLASESVTSGVGMTIIGRTPLRPYIGAFATDRLGGPEGSSVSHFLLRDMARDPALLDALKSKRGFVSLPAGDTSRSVGGDNP